MTQPSNVNRAKITCTQGTICEEWLNVLKPLHGLSDSEIILAARFLDKRMELKEKITDDELIDEYLQSTKTKSLIREAANIKSMAVFQNMMTSLRKKGFFVDGDKIARPFIPNIDRTSKFFKVEFIFKID